MIANAASSFQLKKGEFLRWRPQSRCIQRVRLSLWRVRERTHCVWMLRESVIFLLLPDIWTNVLLLVCYLLLLSLLVYGRCLTVGQLIQGLFYLVSRRGRFFFITIVWWSGAWCRFHVQVFAVFCPGIPNGILGMASHQRVTISVMNDFCCCSPFLYNFFDRLEDFLWVTFIAPVLRTCSRSTPACLVWPLYLSPC